MNIVLVLSFLCVCSLHFAQAIVHEPRNANKGTVEPFVVEFNPEEEDREEDSFMRRAAEEEIRHRSARSAPTTTPPGFGSTFTLTGDHHTYGLVHWSGLPKIRIFMLTRQRNSKGYSTESFLWISKDYGKTFQNYTNLFPSDAVAEWYYISPSANKLVFTDRINQRVYVTLDEGETFDSYHVPFMPDKLAFQRGRAPNFKSYEDHLLGYDKGKRELWLSTNTGKTWTKLGSNVTRYYWRELNTTYEDASTVYFDQMVNENTAMLYKASETNNYQPVLFDNDLGPISPGSFVLAYQYMFVQKNYTILGISTNQSPLLVSLWRGMFQPANFPLDLEERHYALVDASEGQVLMAVYHNPNDTHVYISEAAGLNYTLSLNNIISPPENEWIDSYPTFDVYVVESLFGTFIANRMIPTSKKGSTVISFDKGGEWNPISPPSTDRNGKPINCNPPCSLHLHMYVDSNYKIQPILSQDSAPGIIMAIGNLGQHVTNWKKKLRLYMSDNGGVTWRELFTGYKRFQLLNFGVFTAVVDKTVNTFYTQVSCDEGYNWLNYTFANYTHQVRVINIRTEWGEESQHAIIFGYYAPWSSFEWLIIDLDFTTLNLSQCTKDDYYLWKPTDERPNQDCILGESVEYERRLPDRCCYIDAAYKRPVNRTFCECTNEDFECEVNFERVDFNGPCTPLPGFTYPPDPPEYCPELGNFTFTSGYRKISGDVCVPGDQTFYLPVVQDCPPKAPGDIDLVVVGSVYTVVAGTSVDFSFTQGQGAILSTHYEWSFGDNMTESYIGLASASATSHTYSKPGSYKVQIKAFNDGGQGVDDVILSVSDILTKVNIVAPNFIFVDVPVNFFANITTKFGTKTLFHAVYSWKINGQKEQTDNQYFTHMFSQAGNYKLELTVSYIGGIEENTITLSVTKPTGSVQLSASVDGKVSQNYLPVNVPVTFSVSPVGSSKFSDGTYFHWLMLFSDGTHLYDKNSTDTSVTMTLPRWDKYSLTVISRGVVVAYGVESYVAEEILSAATPTNLNPVYRLNQVVSVDLQVVPKDFPKLTGTLQVMVWQNSVSSGTEIGTGVNKFVLDGTTDKITTSFVTTLGGKYDIVFQTSNNVSQIITTKQIMVASYNQYGYFQLIFSTDGISANYHDVTWQTQLQTEVKNGLANKFSLSSWQLDVNVSEEENTTAFSTGKRASEQLLLVANVYLLPKTLNDHDIQVMFNITDDIITSGNNKKLSFTVGGETISVKEAKKGSIVRIIDPLPASSKTNYLTLAISMGVGGVVLVVIAIAIIVGAIVYYKKKYRSLEVRYSRLRQGPMRFTFSADGENLEEEDWKDDDEGVEPEDDGKDHSPKLSSFRQFKEK